MTGQTHLALVREQLVQARGLSMCKGPDMARSYVTDYLSIQIEDGKQKLFGRGVWGCADPFLPEHHLAPQRDGISDFPGKKSAREVAI